MSRSLDATLAAEFDKDSLSPIGLVEIQTSSGYVRCWSGIGTLTWNGHDFAGTGALGKVSTLEESTELKSGGVVLELSGVPAEYVSIALSEIRQGRRAKVWIGCFEGNQLVGEPFPWFTGLTDIAEIEDNASEVTIRITAENRLIDLERPRVRRYTSEDQKLTDSGDRGFEYVPGLQDTQFVWGKQ